MSGLAIKRLSVREYIRLCVDHFKHYWHQYTLPIVALFLLQIFFRIDVNMRTACRTAFCHHGKGIDFQHPAR